MTTPNVNAAAQTKNNTTPLSTVIQKRYKLLVLIFIVTMSLCAVHISNIETKYTAEITLATPNSYDVTHDSFLFGTNCDKDTNEECEFATKNVNPNLKIFETFIKKGRSHDNWKAFTSSLVNSDSIQSFNDLLVRTSKSPPYTKVRILYRGSSPESSITTLKQFTTYNMLATQASYSEMFDQKLLFEQKRIESKLENLEDIYKTQIERKIHIFKESKARLLALSSEPSKPTDKSSLIYTEDKFDQLHSLGSHRLTIEIESLQRILKSYKSFTPGTDALKAELQALQKIKDEKPAYTAAVIDENAKIIRSNTSEKILLVLIYLFTCLLIQLIVLTSNMSFRSTHNSELL